MDNTTGPLRACVLNEAFDASPHLYLVSKVQTPSVIKQPDSKCFRGLLLLFSTSHAAASLRRPLSISSLWHHHVEIQLSTLYTAPSSNTASWHGLYKPLDLHEGARRVKLQSYLLFYNTLYSNTLAQILGVTFNDGISCKCSMACSSSTE